MTCMGYPHEVTFKVNFAIIQTCVFHSKTEQMYVFLSYYILFGGVCFVLSFSTLMWNAYVAENLFKNKKTRKMKHAYYKEKTHLIILKR